jgi:hypothetical protein
MSADPPRCAIFGASITQDRGGELVTLRGEPGPVWVHPGCKVKQISRP